MKQVFILWNYEKWFIKKYWQNTYNWIRNCRIKRNLELKENDIVYWCKNEIKKSREIYKKGKNWYIYCNNIIITINGNSYTIITAHKKGE